MFYPKGYLDFQWKAEDWRRHLNNDSENSSPRKILLIGGPHKAGTTILWEAIKYHPDISGFGDRFETGVDFSEGILLQAGLVYPRFGVGFEFRHGKDPNVMEGLGKYALANEKKVHWNATSDPGKSKVTPNNFRMLMNRFGPYWKNLNATILVEKSPQNAVMSLFLEALYNVPIVDEGDVGERNIEQSTDSTSVTKHLFITRHPIANAYAHDNILKGSVSFRYLFENYMKVHEYMFHDMPLLRNKPMLVRLEDFAADPLQTLKLIFEWLEVDSSYNLIQDILQNKLGKEIHNNPNQKYVDKWCENYADVDENEKEDLLELQRRLDLLQGLNYDIVNWCKEYEPTREDKNIRSDDL